MEEFVTKEQLTGRARRFMLDRLGAMALCWERSGPRDTNVLCIQCWLLRNHRLVLVEIFRDGGFEVFPQIMLGGSAETALAIQKLDQIEGKLREER